MKSLFEAKNKDLEKVAPLVGAWIEMVASQKSIDGKQSLPSWERGLKCLTTVKSVFVVPSLPSWERGLKSFIKAKSDMRKQVAPLVGAWIEIV